LKRIMIGAAVLLSGCVVEPARVYVPPPRPVYVQAPAPVVYQAPAPQPVVSVYVEPPLFQPPPIRVEWAPPPMLVETPHLCRMKEQSGPAVIGSGRATGSGRTVVGPRRHALDMDGSIRIMNIAAVPSCSSTAFGRAGRSLRCSIIECQYRGRCRCCGRYRWTATDRP